MNISIVALDAAAAALTAADPTGEWVAEGRELVRFTPRRQIGALVTHEVNEATLLDGITVDEVLEAMEEGYFTIVF